MHLIQCLRIVSCNLPKLFKGVRMKFLREIDVGIEINKVLKSDKCVSVVSFVGDHYFDKISNKAKILLNLNSVGTNPYAVEKLLNSNIQCRKSKDYFHAKVYTDNHRAIVGSANLSTNGLEFLDNGTSNIGEAAVVFYANSKNLDEKDMFKRIRHWCVATFESRGQEISVDDLKALKHKWDRISRESRGSKKNRIKTIEELIKNNVGIHLSSDAFDCKYDDSLEEKLEKLGCSHFFVEENVSSKYFCKETDSKYLIVTYKSRYNSISEFTDKPKDIKMLEFDKQFMIDGITKRSKKEILSLVVTFKVASHFLIDVELSKKILKILKFCLKKSKKESSIKRIFDEIHKDDFISAEMLVRLKEISEK